MYSFSIFIYYHTFVYIYIIIFLGGMVLVKAAFWLAPLCAGCNCARHGDRFAGPNSS